jgi:NADP-dependent 3-hydroxy acid dehydrogenase YdfG
MANGPLEGRIALVTGASAGIGEAIAMDFAAKGAGVVINARRVERLETLLGKIERAGGRAAIAPGDAGAPETINLMLERAHEAFGDDADLVVVNAGRGLAGSVLTSDPEQWEELLRTNILGAMRLVRAAAGPMVEMTPADEPTKRARDIVILGSTVGRHISPFSSMYGATKFAVNSMAEATRRELGPKGVRVSLIEPAVVRSEFQQVAGYSDDLVGNFEERFGPLLAPEDIARLVTFIVTQPAHVHINDVVIRSVRQDYP